MRSLTKSGIRELTAKYRSVLKKCAILNAMVFSLGIGCLTTPANALELWEALATPNPDTNTRNYWVPTDPYYANHDLGGFHGNYFAIYGNGKTIDGGNQYKGIEIGNGQTLELNNVSMKHFSGDNVIYNSYGYVSSEGGNFENNISSSYYGGAIYNSGTIGSLIGNFIGNRFDDLHMPSGKGGAIYNSSGSQINRITGDFKDNHANQGGAIYNIGTSYIIAQDGKNIIFEGNTASTKENGGAIYNKRKGIVNLIAAQGHSIEFKTDSDSIYNEGTLYIGQNSSNYTGKVILQDVYGSGTIEVNSGNLELRGNVNDQHIEFNFNFYNPPSLTIAEGGTLNSYIDNTFGTVYISDGIIRNNIAGTGRVYITENKSANIDGNIFLDNLTMQNNSTLNLINGKNETLNIDWGLETKGTAYLSFDIIGDGNDTIHVPNRFSGTLTLKNMNIDVEGNELTKTITLFTNENNYTMNDYLGRSKTENDYYYKLVQDANNKSNLILTKTKQPWTFRQVMNADTKLTDPDELVNVTKYFVNGEMKLNEDIGKIQRYPDTSGRTLTFQGTNKTTDIINGQNYEGITVRYGDTFALDNVSMKNFSNLGEGGAIYNNGGTISNLIGDFSYNNSSSRSDGLGGAIYNSGTISNITGDFSYNSASTMGGAIYNRHTISNITGDFINNSSSTGGAVYNVDLVLIKTTDAKPNIIFRDNYVKDRNNGGAIYNEKGGSVVLLADNGHSITFVGGWDTATRRDIDGIYNAGILNIDGNHTGTVNLYNVNGTGTTYIYGGTAKIADAGGITQNDLTILSGAKLESKADNLHISNSLINNGTLVTNGRLNNLTTLNNKNGTVQIAADKTLDITYNYTLGGTLDLNSQILDMQESSSYSTLTVDTLKGSGNLMIDAALGSTPQSDKIVYTNADNAVINITNINVKEGFTTGADGTLTVLENKGTGPDATLKVGQTQNASPVRLLASNNVNANGALKTGGNTGKTTTIAGGSLYTFEKGETDGKLNVTKQEITSSSVGGAMSNEIEVSGSSVYVDTYSLVADEAWPEEIISNCKRYTVFMNGYNLIGNGNNGATISYQEGRGDEVIMNGSGTISNFDTVFINHGVLTLNNVTFSGNKIDVSNMDRGILNLMGENTFGSKLTGTGKTTNTGTLNISADNLDLVLTNNGTLNLTEGTLTRKVLGEGKINFLNGTALTSPLDKTFIGDNKVNFAGNNVINLIVGNGLTDGEYAFISGSIEGKENTTISDNTLYDLAWSETNDGSITLAKKSTSEVVANLAKEGVNAQQAATISAFADSKGGNPVLSAITEAVQSGNAKAAAKLAEEVAPTTSQTVIGVAQDVNSILSNIVGTRMAAVGRSGGDAFVGGAMWVQGLMNHTKQDSASKTAGFSADTKGISFGLDGKVNKDLMMGFGYGYSNTDADSGERDIDVEGHNFFAYSEYKPNNWYINGMFNYGFSQYEEQKAAGLKAKYDVNTYAANIMTGYDFDNGLTPEVGLRYLLADQDSYNDGAQRIKSDKTDVLTGVVGFKYQTNMQATDWTFTPNLRLFATYDMMSDNSKANVSVIGGGNYQITGKRLERFGVETGIGVETTYGDWNLSLDYNGGFRKDFQSHTGMLKAKYNF